MISFSQSFKFFEIPYGSKCDIGQRACTNNKNVSHLQFPLRLPHNVNPYCIRVHPVYLQKFFCTLIYVWTFFSCCTFNQKFRLFSTSGKRNILITYWFLIFVKYTNILKQQNLDNHWFSLSNKMFELNTNSC